MLSVVQRVLCTTLYSVQCTQYTVKWEYVWIIICVVKYVMNFVLCISTSWLCVRASSLIIAETHTNRKERERERMNQTSSYKRRDKHIIVNMNTHWNWNWNWNMKLLLIVWFGIHSWMQDTICASRESNGILLRERKKKAELIRKSIISVMFFFRRRRCRLHLKKASKKLYKKYANLNAEHSRKWSQSNYIGNIEKYFCTIETESKMMSKLNLAYRRNQRMKYRRTRSFLGWEQVCGVEHVMNERRTKKVSSNFNFNRSHGCV